MAVVSEAAGMEPVIDLTLLARATEGDYRAGAPRTELERSFRDVAAFRRALFAWAPRRLRGFGSRLDGTIDAFHDLLEIHAESGRMAVIDSGDGQTLRGMSYAKLFQDSIALASTWARLGVGPGMRVSIIAGATPRRIVGMMAGLRLGAVMSLVEPVGRMHVRNRLQWLAPDLVASADELAWYGLECGALPLTASTAELGGTAYRYGLDEPMLSFVSPLASGMDGLCELSAGDLMARLLCDALLLLKIQPGEHVSAVGGCRAVLEPSLWLCTLLAGGCFVDLQIAACKAQPALLGKASVHHMLVSAELLPLLSRHPDLCASWKQWSLDPSAMLPFQEFWGLAEQLAARGVPGLNLIYSAPFGGALAFSPLSLRLDPLRVLPAPGVPFCLHDVSGTAAAVPVDHGVFAVSGSGTAQLGGLLLAESGAAYSVSGALVSRVRGLPYQRDELVELVRSHPAVQAATVVVIPDRTVMNDGVAHLLLFVDPYHPLAAEPASLALHIADMATYELGAQVEPLKVEVFPFAPRRVSGEVDPVWATGQYVTGMLFRKRELKTFAALGKLRRLFALEQPLD